MVQFKSAPGSRQAMFNRNPSISFQQKPNKLPAKVNMARAPKRTLKHAELGQTRLTTTNLSNKASRNQQVVQMPTIRLTGGDTTGAQIVVSSDAAAGVVAAVGIGAAVVWILGIVVLIFTVWGIVRSGQEVAAKNSTDPTASPWFFGAMIAAAALYIVLSIVGSSRATDMSSAISGISGTSASEAQEAAVAAASASAGSQAAYGVGAVFGIGAFCMSIAALARLKLTKTRYAKFLSSR